MIKFKTNVHEPREQNEARFHDARVNSAKSSRLGYVYASVVDVYDFVRSVPRSVSGGGGEVVELGCFTGQGALSLDGVFRHYTGIDLSAEAIEACKRLGLSDRYSFRVDDGQVLATISPESVDYAFGEGVLHHLDLERFSLALRDKLNSRGLARFVEPASGNFAIRWFRRLTPRLRTIDERPFDEASFQILAKHFEVTVQHHALLRPFVPMLFLNSVAVTSACRRLDAWLMKFRLLQKQAWLLTIELRLRAGSDNLPGVHGAEHAQAGSTGDGGQVAGPTVQAGTGQPGKG